MALRKMRWLAFILIPLLLGGCVTAPKQPESPLAPEQTLMYNIGVPPRTLDPQKSASLTEGDIELACFEGLTRLDQGDLPQPGIAENWSSDPEGKVWTFRLRNSTWANGDGLGAEDFLFAWRRAINPESPSDYAPLFDIIQGAEEIRTGKEKDLTRLGVRAVDPNTLEVTLRHADPFFPVRTAHHAFFPLHRTTLEQHPQDWDRNPQTYLGNGPFRITQWGQQILLEKNPTYWDAQGVQLQKINLLLLNSEAEEQSQLAQGALDVGIFPPGPDQLEAVKKGEGPYKYISLLSNYYFEINTTRKPLDKVNVRRALGLALNRQLIAAQAGVRGGEPLTAWIPLGFYDRQAPGLDFRAEGGASPLPDNALDEAKKLLADAGYPGGKGFPKFSLLYNAQEPHKAVAEAAAAAWQALGLEVELREKPWEEYVKERSAGNFSLARGGWIADNRDPLPPLESYASWSSQNRSGWINADFDRLIREAQNTLDLNQRTTALHQAETLLLNEMPVIPVQTYSQIFPFNPKIQDAVLSLHGAKDFKKAWKAK